MNDFRSFFESQYTWIAGYMRNVRRYGNRLAIINPDDNRMLTYLDFNKEVNRLCSAFAGDDIANGSVIMFSSVNCPEFAFGYVAAHKIHSVFCPVSYRMSSGELALTIDDSQPAVFIFDNAIRQTVLESLQLSHFRPKRLVSLNGKTDVEITSYEDYISDCSEAEPVSPCDYNMYDETLRIYSSGTTGRPKGVPLMSINEVLTAHDVMFNLPMNYEDITMNTTPWLHRGGLCYAGPCCALYAGSAMVVLSKFDPETALEYVDKYKVTFLAGVPTILEQLADSQERLGYDLSPLRGIMTMGSPLERAACIRYQKVLTPNIFNGYGITEMHLLTLLRPSDLPEFAGTAGRSCADEEVRVVKLYDERRAEPDDLVAKDGKEVGEVIASSPANSPYRYHNNEEETDRKYYKGFIYTNDLATWDENQYLTIVGRRDDMIISAGENIYPVEVESVINSHPKVKECIVTSVPDKVKGQVVTAFVMKSDETLTPEELDTYCKQSPYLASYKRPRFYRFVSQIPLNALGKKQHSLIKNAAISDLKNGLLYPV